MSIEDLKNVSTKPGVYLWKDKYGKIIYVGKANNLKNRMQQYFKGALNSYKTTKLVENIASFETIIVSNTKEALVLERNLIKEHNPEFNILLKDDKRYPYIKIQKTNDLKISLERRIRKSSNIFYYGPFPNGYGAITLLKLLEREANYNDGLPIQNPSKEFIEAKFEKIKNILSSKSNSYISELEEKMLEAAEKENFEIAKDYRDSIEYLKKIKENQIVELGINKNFDVISIIESNSLLIITIMFYRYGNLLMKEEKVINIFSSLEETIIEFLSSFYDNNFIPDEIILDQKFKTIDFQIFDNDLKFHFPEKGIMKKMLEIAELNSKNDLENKEKEFINKNNLKEENLKKLYHLINIEKLSNIIMIDNSHTNNSLPVSAIVVYENGIKNKNKYRKFYLDRIQNREADVEYMRQSIIKYLNMENKILPDIIFVDGALAQVREIKKVLQKEEINIPVIGLVKNEKHTTDHIIGINEERIEILDRNLLNFLREIQYEVDRFAKYVHTNKRNRTSLQGSLLEIKGLGEKMEFKLLEHFKTYSNIYNATIEELSKIVPIKIAKEIKEKIK